MLLWSWQGKISIPTHTLCLSTSHKKRCLSPEVFDWVPAPS